jgi:hypothetical protein
MIRKINKNPINKILKDEIRKKKFNKKIKNKQIAIIRIKIKSDIKLNEQKYWEMKLKI